MTFVRRRASRRCHGCAGEIGDVREVDSVQTSRIIRCLLRSPHPAVPPVLDAPFRGGRVEDQFAGTRTGEPLVRPLRAARGIAGGRERRRRGGVPVHLARVPNDELIARAAWIEPRRHRNAEPTSVRGRRLGFRGAGPIDLATSATTAGHSRSGRLVATSATKRVSAVRIVADPLRRVTPRRVLRRATSAWHHDEARVPMIVTRDRGWAQGRERLVRIRENLASRIASVPNVPPVVLSHRARVEIRARALVERLVN